MLNLRDRSRCHYVRVIMRSNGMVRPVHGMISGSCHSVAPPETPVGPKDYPFLGRNAIISQLILRMKRPEKSRSLRLAPRVLAKAMPLLPARFPLLGLVNLINSLAG